jgi:hypothetical protein
MVEIIWEWLAVWVMGGWWRFGCTTSLISAAMSFGVNGNLLFRLYSNKGSGAGLD